MRFPIIFDPERFSDIESVETDIYRIGYLGSFGKKDGVPGILDAYNIARKKIPKLKLRLIGYQIRAFKLNEELEKRGLENNENIEITGQVLYKDIPKLLSECGLLVMNRTSSEYANHGFPTKLGEYLATGRPVVSSDTSDIASYFTDGKDIRIIEPDNATQLAEVMIERIENKNKYDEIGVNGKLTANNNFDYHKVLPKIHTFLKDQYRKLYNS